MGSALKGSKLGEFWKYRVGDYRIICRIEDQKLLILVLRIGLSAGIVSLSSEFWLRKGIDLLPGI